MGGDEGTTGLAGYEVALQLEEWRQQQFKSLGLDEHEATILAFHGVSHHFAEDLIQNGCPVDRVFAILKP